MASNNKDDGGYVPPLPRQEQFFRELESLQPQQSWISSDGKPFASYDDCVCYMCFMHIWNDIFKPRGVVVSRKDLVWLLQNDDFHQTFLTFRQHLTNTVSLEEPPPDPGELDVDAMLESLKARET